MTSESEDTARIQDIEDKKEVKKLDDNRVVIQTGAAGNGDVSLSVTLESEDGVEMETFTADSTYAVFTKFLSWYAAYTDDDGIRQLLRDI